MKILVVGAPRTKKTHNRAAVRKSHKQGQPCPWCKKPLWPFVLPSDQWKEWCKKAAIWVDDEQLVRTTQKPRILMVVPVGGLARVWRPMLDDVNCRAIFWRDRDQGDTLGFKQGLADLLQERGVIGNDSQLKTWDGSRLELTSGRPRVDVELTPIGEMVSWRDLLKSYMGHVRDEEGVYFIDHGACKWEITEEQLARLREVRAEIE